MPRATPLDAAPFLLRPYGAGDLALYAALFADALVMHRVGPPFSPERAARAAAASLDHQSREDRRFRHWVVERDGAALGLLGLALRSPSWRQGRGELGLLLWPAAQAHGAGTAAITAVQAWAFHTAGLDVLTGHHAEGHAGMAALLRRTGFEPVAPQPDAPMPCGWRCLNPANVAAQRDAGETLL